jgi:CheY-like chemotaxis protein
VTTSNAPLTGDMVSTRPDVSPRDYVVLELADTGCGMTPKILARVFDPFFTTKDVGKGTGLGLSMVHGFVEQSGGFVDIESEPGHGTVVRIHLPRAETDTPATAPDPGIAKINDGTRATVLVVEDDRGVRELVVQMLRELGFATVEAQDGAATLKILEQRPDIDLVFIDVVLPGKWSGVDVAARIAEHRPDIRFIFTSGYPDGEIANSAPGQFPADFLRKPYLKSDLARTLNEVLENHPAK